jgi:hypothetical protein
MAEPKTWRRNKLYASRAARMNQVLKKARLEPAEDSVQLQEEQQQKSGSKNERPVTGNSDD